MAIKSNEAGRRWVEVDLVVPATPEQLWEAVATGPGNTAWFVRAEIEPHVGGDLLLDFGADAISRGEVTEWEPPRRFGYVEPAWQQGGPSVATEVTVARRTAETSVLRMTHSIDAATDAWDSMIERFEKGWQGFFVVLQIYLAHFAGRPAASFMAVEPTDAGTLAAWRTVCEALGLAGANVGERREPHAGPESWSGVVEHVHQDAEHRWVVLRLDGAADGVLMVGVADTSEGASVNVCRYDYGEDAADRIDVLEPRWRSWLADTFGAARES